MTDDTRANRPPDDDGQPSLPGLGEGEGLEFINKEPVEMSEQPPRDDHTEDAVPEETYEEVSQTPPPTRRRGLVPAGGTNRVMIITGIVVVAAALFIFWPRGGEDLPEPVGEQFSVVAADSGAVEADRPERPRSSDVNLSLEAPDVVPEEAGGTVDESPPETSRPEPSRPAAGSGEPGETGKWAIQLGSFGSRTNAQEMAGELRAEGFRVETPTMQSTTGGAQTKVWIAYFETHAAAKAWAAAHVDEIGRSTYITHR